LRIDIPRLSTGSSEEPVFLTPESISISPIIMINYLNLTDLIKEDEDRVMIVDLGPIEGRIEERIEFLGMHPDQKDFHF
jgi:hypothetical protein